MTVLTDIIARQIERMGPITIADYMTQCLYHPDHGYYTSTHPLGASGDFITAPEISQMFGEMIGLCLAQTWIDQGAPNPFCLAELGPGKGTLMADILRATQRIEGFHEAMQLHLVETSPTLRETQRAILNGYTVTWTTAIDTLPALPLFLIANEFFDCLPIRQFKRTEAGWQEQMVAQTDGNLAFLLGQLSPPDLYSDAVIPVGGTLELCTASNAIIADISASIANQGGAALIVDYGDWGSGADTLQALQNHTKIDPLTQCGAADITAHVDFKALTKSAATAQVSALTPQGVLLERLGITQRAQSLASRLTGTALDTHIAAHRRLTHPDEMGQLFKSIAIVPKGAALPPGYDHA